MCVSGRRRRRIYLVTRRIYTEKGEKNAAISNVGSKEEKKVNIYLGAKKKKKKNIYTEYQTENKKRKAHQRKKIC